MNELAPLDSAVLPAGIRSRFVPDINGLRVHILEADQPAGPVCCCCTGFPNWRIRWRKVMPALADAGYHVVAPDLRGYGRTTGWHADYDSEADLRSFRLLNAVRDQLGLVHALGHRSVAAVVGHDFGSPVAAWCALVRPDVFRSVALMSAPFEGPPEPDAGRIARRHPRGDGGAAASTQALSVVLLHAPRQRGHVALQAGRARVPACLLPPQERRLAAEQAVPSAGWTAEELAKMPTYYIMDLGETMAETVAHEMPSAAEIAACRWLPDNELAVYAGEYERNGFAGGLQWYRRGTTGLDTSELQLFAGRTIDVPSMFVAGSSDWGTYQRPGAFERMQESACTQHARLPPDRRRRTLGAAGTGGEGERAAGGVPAALRASQIACCHCHGERSRRHEPTRDRCVPPRLAMTACAAG